MTNGEKASYKISNDTLPVKRGTEISKLQWIQWQNLVEVGSDKLFVFFCDSFYGLWPSANPTNINWF